MILERFIAINLVKAWLVTVLILGSVFGLMSFIQELDRTRFDYNAMAVARYTLMALPQQIVSLSPVIALLGSMAALSRLCQSNELTIVACTGFRKSQLLRAIGYPTLVFMLILWICMEFITAPLLQTAERQKSVLRDRNTVIIPAGGLWSVSPGRFAHLGKLLEGDVPGDIDVFEFDEDGELTRAVYGRTAEIIKNRRWLLQNVREKVLVDDILVTRWHKELEVTNLWKAEELPTLSITSEAMSLSSLHQYSQYLESNDQPTKKYRSLFWQKMLMPLTVGAMILLATPMSISSTAGRDRSFGINMAIGALVGILFYLGSQIVFALGHLLQLSLPVIAALPFALVLLCAVVLLKRMRW
jgi:lipopolysaccharide export system permease protein